MRGGSHFCQSPKGGGSGVFSLKRKGGPTLFGKKIPKFPSPPPPRKNVPSLREFVCHSHEMYAVRPTSLQGVSHLFAELSRFLSFYFKNHYCCINIHLAHQGSYNYCILRRQGCKMFPEITSKLINYSSHVHVNFHCFDFFL